MARMRKLINDPEQFVDEMLEGLLLAHPERLRALVEESRAVVLVGGDQGSRVVIATGGGSGHLPLFVGYVRPGFAMVVVSGICLLRRVLIRCLR